MLFQTFLSSAFNISRLSYHLERPSIASVKDSGSLEEDADLLLMLYRDGYYNQDTEDVGIMEIIVGKNRNGSTGTCQVIFNPVSRQFKNFK